MAKGIRYLTLGSNGANQRVMGPNPNRVAVIISPSGSNNLVFKFGEPVTAATDGIYATQGRDNVVLTREQLGEVIMLPLHVWGTAGQNYTVCEVTGERLADPDITGP